MAKFLAANSLEISRTKMWQTTFAPKLLQNQFPLNYVLTSLADTNSFSKKFSQLVLLGETSEKFHTEFSCYSCPVARKLIP